MRIILLLLICCLITSCTRTRAPPVQVTYGERQSLYFTGRGSAAGIMMDSLLGGAGIAIGIAIDEGIAKDISAAILAANPDFSMDALVRDVLHEKVKQGMNVNGLTSVVIVKYGFQAAPDDKVVPLVVLQLNCESAAIPVIEFISDEKEKAIPFEQSKTDGALVEKLLRDTTGELLGMYNACKGDV